MLKCTKCGMEFNDEKRLERHFNTHIKKEKKGRREKKNSLPDFDKPNFTQVM